MPGIVDIPAGTVLASELKRQFDTIEPGFDVSYMPVLKGDGKTIDEARSYFHITNARGSRLLSTNLNIDTSYASLFESKSKTPLTGLKVRTDDPDKAYSILGTIVGKFIKDPKETRYRAGDPSVTFEARSPTRSLAYAVAHAFNESHADYARGSTDVDVRGKLFSRLAEGSNEDDPNLSVPKGTKLIDRRATETTDIERTAAKSFGVEFQYADSRAVPEIQQQKAIQKAWDEAVATRREIKSPDEPDVVLDPAKLQRYQVTWARTGAARLEPNAVNYLPSTMPVTGAPTYAGYQVSEKGVQKHQTTLHGRPAGTPLGPDYRPLEAGYMPEGKLVSGYYQSGVAEGDEMGIGSRIARRSLVLGGIITPDVLSAGAAPYFPQTVNADIKTVGQWAPKGYELTRDIGGLMSGEVGVRTRVGPGLNIPSASRFIAAQVKTRESSNWIDISDRTEAHGYHVQGTSIAAPSYWNPKTGMGVEYDEEAYTGGRIEKIPDDFYENLRKQTGLDVRSYDTRSAIELEVGGYSDIAAKLAGGMLKAEPVPVLGTPDVKLGNLNLPVSLMTFEAKSMPEMVAQTIGAGLTPKKRALLLEEYASTLPKDDPRRTVMSKYAAQSRTGEDFQYDAMLEEIGATRGEPAYPAPEFAKDILQNVIFRKPFSEVSKMNEKELADFAWSKQNLSNLRRFNMGLIAGTPNEKGEYMSPLIEEDWHESQIQGFATTFRQMLKENPKLLPDYGLTEQSTREEMDAAFYKSRGLAPAAVGDMRHRAYHPSGLYMPIVAPLAAEYSGGGEISFEDALLMNKISPGFAKRLNLGMTDILGLSSIGQNEIKDPVKWAYTQMANVAMQQKMVETGASPLVRPDKITITRDIASQMLMDPDIQAGLNPNNVNLAQLSNLQSAMLKYFPDVIDAQKKIIETDVVPGLGLPSLEAASILSVEDPSTMTTGKGTGTDITRHLNMYAKALGAMITGKTAGEIQGETGKLQRHYLEQFGLEGDVARKMGVVRSILKMDQAQTVGRFSSANQLAETELFGSETVLKTHIRQQLGKQGMEFSEDEVEEAYRALGGESTAFKSIVGGDEKAVNKMLQYVQRRGAPVMGQRYPAVGESMQAFNLVTQRHLVKSGRGAIPLQESGLSNPHWRVGARTAEEMLGDLDLDMLGGILGLKFTRNTEGKLKMSFGGFTEAGNVDERMKNYLSAKKRNEYTATQRRYFALENQANQYNALLKLFKEQGPGGLTSTVDLMKSQAEKARYMTFGKVAELTQTYLGSKHQMGIAYDFTRAMASSRETAGWSTKDLLRAEQTRAPLYQPHLDLATDLPATMISQFQTAALTKNKEGKLGFTWGLPRANASDDIDWFKRGAEVNELSADNIFGLVGSLAGTASYPANNQLVAPDVLASIFSPEGSRAFTPERPRANQAEIDAIYKSYTDAQAKGEGARASDEILPEWYRRVNLEEALTPLYKNATQADTGTARNIAQTITEWTRANYAPREVNGVQEDRRLQVAESPIVQAYFAKAYRSYMRNHPNEPLPKEFVSSALGQKLIQSVPEWGVRFDLKRGRMPIANEILKVYSGLEQRQREGRLDPMGAWVLNFGKRLGLQGATAYTDLTDMYERAQAEPVRIRASQLGGILHGTEDEKITGKGYSTSTVTGEYKSEDYGKISREQSTLYSIGGLLGVSRGELNKLSGAIYPNLTHQKDFERGADYESKLGAVMTKQQGWFTTHRYGVDPTTGKWGRVEEETDDRRYQGAFVWRGELDGENVEAAATPDWLVTKDIGDPEAMFTTFMEQKSPGRRSEESMYQAQGGAHILQSRQTAWIINKLMQTVARGGEEGELAKESIMATLSSFGLRGDLLKKTYRGIEKGMYGTQVFYTGEGGPIMNEVGRGRYADPEAITKMIAEQETIHPDIGFVPKGPNDPDLIKQEEFNIKAAHLLRSERDEHITSLAGKMSAASGWWGKQAARYMPKIVEAKDILYRVMGNVGILSRQAAVAQPTPEQLEEMGIKPGEYKPSVFAVAQEEAGLSTREYLNAWHAGGAKAFTVDEFREYQKGATERYKADFEAGTATPVGAPPRGVTVPQQFSMIKEMGHRAGLDPTPVYDDKTGSKTIKEVTWKKWEPIQPVQQVSPQETVPVEPVIPTPPVDTPKKRGRPRKQPDQPGGPPIQPPDSQQQTAIPTPPPDDGSSSQKPDDKTPPVVTAMTDPTARAVAFLDILKTNRAKLLDASQKYRVELGALIGGAGAGPVPAYGTGGALEAAKFTQEQISQQFGGYADQARIADDLMKRAAKVNRELKYVDPRIAGSADLKNALNEVMLTTGPVGAAVTDLGALQKLAGFTKAEAAGDTKAAVSPDIVTARMDALARSTERVTKVFADLTSGAIDQKKAQEELTRIALEDKLGAAQYKYEQEAAPLVQAGVLRPSAVAGLYERVSGVQATEEQAKIYEKFTDAEKEVISTSMEMQAGKEDKGLGGFFRKALGGFGMMYMRSILNFATQGLDLGYAERVAMEDQFAKSAAGYTGAAILPRNQQQILANKRAIAGSDYLGMTALQGFLQTTPGVSDIYTTATAGLGAYAGATWMSSMLPGGKDSWLAKGAMPIGMAIGAASLIASGLQKSQAPEGIALRRATTNPLMEALNVTDTLGMMFSERGTAGVSEDTASYLRLQTTSNAGLTLNEMIRREQEYSSHLREYQVRTGEGPGKLVRTGTTPQGAPIYERVAEPVIPEGGYDAGTIYMRQLRNLQTQYPELSPEAVATAYQFAGMTNIPQNRVGEVASFMTSTGYSQENAANILTAFGISPYRQYQGGELGQFYLSQMGAGVTSTQAYQQGLGAQMVGQTGMAGYYMGQGLGPASLAGYAQTLGANAGTPLGNIWTAQMNQWQAQRQLGWNVAMPTVPGPAQEQPTQEELGIESLRQARVSGQIDAATQLSEIYTKYLGYTEGQAMELAKEQEGRPQQAIEADVARAEAIARIVAQQRQIAPGREEEYYTKYRDQLMGLEMPELTIQQDLQQMFYQAAINAAMANMPTEPIEALQTAVSEERMTPDMAQRIMKREAQGRSAIDELATSWQLSEGRRRDLREEVSGMAYAGNLSQYQVGVMQGVAGFDPMAMTRAYAMGGIPGLENVNPLMVGREIAGAGLGPLAGTALNMPIFSTGMNHPLAATLQSMIPGIIETAIEGMPQTAGQAFGAGFSIPGTNMPAIGGLQGMQMYMQWQQLENQAAGVGLQQQSHALQMEYLPRIWGVQDQMTQLGYEQQMWGFERQRQGLGMQQRQFMENFGMQQQQATMQRGWTREDWAFQDQQRTQQWGWRLEDFQENARFMTGRDRRLAERQMARETITHDQEGEQIDKQRSRQEELWKLEDERFEAQLRQFMENQKFQEEGIAKQQEYYEERFRLERELEALQRELQMKQLGIQKEQIALQAKMIADSKQVFEIQSAISTLELIQSAYWEKIAESGQTAADAWGATINQWLTSLGVEPIDFSELQPEDDGGTSGGGGGGLIPSLVESAPITTTLTTYDPWASTITPTTPPVSTKETMIVVVNIGNEELDSYIIDSITREL